MYGHWIFIEVQFLLVLVFIEIIIKIIYILLPVDLINNVLTLGKIVRELGSQFPIVFMSETTR